LFDQAAADGIEVLNVSSKIKLANMKDFKAWMASKDISVNTELAVESKQCKDALLRPVRNSG